MAEYINKAELMEWYLEFDGYTFADVTTIDIVHCRDCKHFEDNKGIDGEYCRHNGFGVSGDWFCADGERRTE